MDTIHWYPGHMTKARRTIESTLKQIDVVVELVDSRAPKATRNPDFDSLFRQKKRLVILNKSDLSDKNENDKWVSYYKNQDIDAIPFVASESKQRAKALKAIERVAQSSVDRMAEKGVRKTVRVLVAGIPNVGKSTFINTVSGIARATTGDKPGMTRGKQWVSISPYLELMDTPGLLWPKMDDQQAALYLSFIQAIRDEVLDEEQLATKLIELLIERSPDRILENYKKLEKDSNPSEYLDLVARSRGFLLRGGEMDYARAASTVLGDFRSAKLGKITLESPPKNEESE